MKKYRLIKTIILGVSLVTLASCGDDFLDVDNPNAIEVSELASDNDGLNSLLNAVYSSFSKEQSVAVLMESKRSDLVYPGGLRPYQDGTKPFYDQNFTNVEGAISNKWATLYEGVFRANQVIESYENISYNSERDSSIGRFIYAQARALRGYFYFQLSNSFNNGSVPIFVKPSTSPAETREPLSSKQEVIDFYREDLNYGLENLPTIIGGSSGLGRITKGACEALLGKSYLYQHEFAEGGPTSSDDLVEAMKHFENLMPSGVVDGKGLYPYSLTDNIGDNFTALNEFNSESILEINYSSQLAQDETGEASLSQSISRSIGIGQFRSSISPASWIVIQYRRDSIDPTNPMNTVSNPFYNPEGVNDETLNPVTKLKRYSHRMSQSIAYIDDIDTGFYGEDVTERRSGGQVLSGENGNRFWKKLTNWNIARDELSITEDNKSGLNLRLIRLADIYLMYAECLLELNRVDDARTVINYIRDRSGVVLLGPATSATYNGSTYTTDGKVNPYIDINGNGEEDIFERHSYDDYETLRYHLRHVERPLELAIEGNAIRTIDLRRWGVTKERFEYLASLNYAMGSYRVYTDSYFESFEEFVTRNATNPSNENYVHRWSTTIYPLYEPNPSFYPSDMIDELSSADTKLYSVYDNRYENRAFAKLRTKVGVDEDEDGEDDPFYDPTDKILTLDIYTTGQTATFVGRYDAGDGQRQLNQAPLYKDLVKASVNYDESKAYLPLPLTEINANSTN